MHLLDMMLNPDFVQNMEDDRREFYIAKAEETIQKQLWKSILASDYMEFFINGDRNKCEKKIFSKRSGLMHLVIAECIEHRSEFLNEIVNGIWNICEESSWVIPAHNNHYHQIQGDFNCLPRVNEEIHFIDLFSAETGACLAITFYLLKKKLDKISPVICQRIVYEIDRRIITPYEICDDFGWMGLKKDSGHKVNNWNPWIHSNCILSAILIDLEAKRKERIINKIQCSLNVFLNEYGDDGGCDEGPHYWCEAGATYLECLELLESVTKRKNSLWMQIKIKNIAKYISNVHIYGNYFANFADGEPELKPYGYMIYRIGELLKDDELMQFGIYMDKHNGKSGKYEFGMHPYRTVKEIAGYEIIKNKTCKLNSKKNIWMENIQVMLSREENDGGKGLCLVAKGGHNDESHNHNDVGNFIIYKNGKPGIIDVGVETYTAKSFSSQRYEIWTMQSDYHNLPQINGYQQHQGKYFRAQEVDYHVSEKEVVLNMDLADAYPKKANIKKFIRTINYKREESKISIVDHYKMEHTPTELRWSLMLAKKPFVEKPGRIIIFTENSTILFKYDDSNADFVVEEILLEDDKMQRSWGKKIYRVFLKAKKLNKEGQFEMIFM